MDNKQITPNWDDASHYVNDIGERFIIDSNGTAHNVDEHFYMDLSHNLHGREGSMYEGTTLYNDGSVEFGLEAKSDPDLQKEFTTVKDDNVTDKPTKKKDSIKKKYNVSEETIKQDNSEDKAIENNPDDVIGATPPTPGYGTDKYIIQKGDTLSEIADNNNKNGGQFMSVEALALLNGIENPNLINTGDELTLTVDPSVVEASIEKITTMISNVQNLQTQIPKLAEFGTTDNGQLDEIARGIISDINTSTTTIISNAELYQKWLNDLLTALSDTELYATNVIDSNTMFNVSNVE